MPRAPVAGREIRRRSRNGCWNCKARKVKCGEEKPRCSNCERLDEECDYKIRLSWGGRPLKKKQLDQNGNGQDPAGDDQSQFIPGAGQFSLNQHFPTPQTFVPTGTNNGVPRKPPVPRVGNGKRSNMSNFQTVFAVGETAVIPPAPVTPPQTQPAPQSPAAKPANGVAQVDPRLSVSIPPPQPHGHIRSQSVSQQSVTQRPHPPQRHNSTSYGWQQGALPPTPYDDSNGRDNGYGPYTPSTTTTGPFSSQTTSPIAHFNDHSPPGHVGSVSPDTPYAAVLGGSPDHLNSHSKNFHHPPPIVTSPPTTKKVRTTTSPTQPPPNSPFIFGRHNGYGGAMPPHTASIAETLDYMNTPGTVGPMASTAELHHAMNYSAVTTGADMGNHTVMRRVSVENLLAAPLPTNYSGGYDRYPTDLDGFKTEDIPAVRNLHYSTGHDTDDDDDDDDDVEEIIRNDLEMEQSGYGSALQAATGGFDGNPYRLHAAYLDWAIPGRLDPLPQLLRSNKKNRMYFHHYLNHTARLLVPHDCSENPFKSILPQMAVETDHLMNLLLAYSASHRARLLEHPEPTERIGRFIDETVRSLNEALGSPKDATSDASLATAIMLASYQIVSPNPFAANGLTWQVHLDAARRIIAQRGGAQGMHSGDTVSYFLVRWFAYLDLLGRLSGREIDVPLFSDKYWTNDNANEDEFAVDCFFGFTTRCVSILAKIGELARRSERERSQAQHYWQPSQGIINEAMQLQLELQDSRKNSQGNCGHSHETLIDGTLQTMHSDMVEQEELLATNDSYHYAAEIQLFRRVLNYPSSHELVQTSVAYIVQAMHKVRQGGAAENCVLFPLFTAGCEAINFGHRDYTLRRMLQIEKTGLTQVKNARLLMQNVWGNNVSWWEIVSGEFLG